MNRTGALLSDGREEGARSEGNQIFCTYLRGLFDHPEAGEILLVWCGLKEKRIFDNFLFKEKELDRVADMLETCLHLDELSNS